MPCLVSPSSHLLLTSNGRLATAAVIRSFRPMPPIALVTGGAVRIGRAITIGLAKCGYDVVVNYHTSEKAARDLEATLTEQGREVLLAHGDISTQEAIEKISQSVKKRFGRLDVLVNNASSFFSTSLLDIDSEEWDYVLDSNLKASHLTVREFAPLLKESSGCVVNIADYMGLQPLVHYAHHSVAKAALMHLTRIQAMALAPKVRVNAVAPGLVLAPEGMGKSRLGSEIKATLLKRMGTVEDVVHTVLFLVQSPYMTGQTVIVDGGASVPGGLSHRNS